MAEQEAIAIIKKNYPKCCKMVNGRYEGGFDDTDCELGQAFNIAIKALEEVQQYRAIGTPEECRAAMGRSNEKTRIIDGITECCGYDFGIDAFQIELSKFCPVCGRKIEQEGEQ